LLVLISIVSVITVGSAATSMTGPSKMCRRPDSRTASRVKIYSDNF